MGKESFQFVPKVCGGIFGFFSPFFPSGLDWRVRARLGQLGHQEKPCLSKQGNWERAPLGGNLTFCFGSFLSPFAPVCTLVSCCSYGIKLNSKRNLIFLARKRDSANRERGTSKPGKAGEANSLVLCMNLTKFSAHTLN